MEYAIEAIGLVKSYPKGVTALDGLSFSVEAVAQTWRVVPGAATAVASSGGGG
jgi:hypothetical protein